MKTYWEQTKDAQEKAISPKLKVGAVCVGWNWNTLKRKTYSGSNLHVSDSFADVHAEQLAVIKCILDRYYPLKIHVTSKNKKEHIILCGICRQFISEINRTCTLVIHNPDGSYKEVVDLDKVHPNSKNTKDKNIYFMKLCGYRKRR